MAVRAPRPRRVRRRHQHPGQDRGLGRRGVRRRRSPRTPDRRPAAAAASTSSRTSPSTASPACTPSATSPTSPTATGDTLPQLGSVAQQSGRLGRGEHPARAARRADEALPLQGQGHHGDDRPQRGRRRGRQAPPRGRGPDRVRRLARRARDAAERRAQQDRRLPHLGLGLLRPRPRRHRRGLRGAEAHRLGRPRGRRPPHLARRPTHHDRPARPRRDHS